MVKFNRGSGITIDIWSEPVNITSERTTPNEHWTYTDAAGHFHRYLNGYPSLQMVVDAHHWCDGNEGFARHDPHDHVDEFHYICSQCSEIIKPTTDPPYTPKFMKGPPEGTVSGPRHNEDMVVGCFATVVLTNQEIDEIQAAPADSVEEIAQRILNTSDHVTSVTYRSG